MDNDKQMNQYICLDSTTLASEILSFHCLLKLGLQRWLSSFQMTVDSNYVIAIATLSDWL